MPNEPFQPMILPNRKTIALSKLAAVRACFKDRTVVATTADAGSIYQLVILFAGLKQLCWPHCMLIVATHNLEMQAVLTAIDLVDLVVMITPSTEVGFVVEAKPDVFAPNPFMPSDPKHMMTPEFLEFASEHSGQVLKITSLQELVKQAHGGQAQPAPNEEGEE